MGIRGGCLSARRRAHHHQTGARQVAQHAARPRVSRAGAETRSRITRASNGDAWTRLTPWLDGSSGAPAKPLGAGAFSRAGGAAAFLRRAYAFTQSGGAAQTISAAAARDYRGESRGD